MKMFKYENADRNNWIETITEQWAETEGYDLDFARRYVTKLAVLIEDECCGDEDVIKMWKTDIWERDVDHIMDIMDDLFTAAYKIYTRIANPDTDW